MVFWWQASNMRMDIVVTLSLDKAEFNDKQGAYIFYDLTEMPWGKSFA